MIAIRVESLCFHTSQTPYAVEAYLLTWGTKNQFASYACLSLRVAQ